ncbi:MAG: protein-methionine-sulfoxide reductase catalytic subunit MsrP [Polynucleobacter sp.]|nr:MAG: protein-methionine-sulfoxide reductase catalytic subunit MsrP [Polynucleobacter sp.]
MKQADIPSPSEITPQAVYEKRRQLILMAAAGAFGVTQASFFNRQAHASVEQKIQAKKNPSYFVPDKLTSYKDITSYNNFYEFGTDKSDPARNAHTLRTRPWTVSIEGLVKKPKVWDIDQLFKLSAMEERVYRFRCVEGWSMVIPWNGYSLAHLIKASDTLGSAKYVEFISLADKEQMPGVRNRILNWPYTEGLRIDEAMHPLTLLSFGLYGELLPKQNGAPVRLVIPWKYGFKSAKSIVKIRFTDKEPATSWKVSAPYEYGFYSNVNPDVSHPRWSQATERRIGDEGGIFAPKIKTLPFNGYADQVAHLYQGMDLKKYF